MMEQWLLNIFEFLPGGMLFAAAVFVIAFLEALVGIGLLMPGSVLTVFSGWMAYQGKAPITAIMAAAALGAVSGDLLSYWLGARFSARIWRWRLLQKRQNLLRLTEVFFLENGGKGVFFGRFLGPIRGLVPFIAGASKMRPAVFSSYAIISGILWGISYPGLGYLGGASWQRAETLAGRLGLLIMLVLIVTLLVAWLRHRFLPRPKMRDAKRDKPPSS
ncbi:MAG: DedA family protein [Desulfuromonadales bacterium]